VEVLQVAERLLHQACSTSGLLLLPEALHSLPAGGLRQQISQFLAAISLSSELPLECSGLSQRSPRFGPRFLGLPAVAGRRGGKNVGKAIHLLLRSLEVRPQLALLGDAGICDALELGLAASPPLTCRYPRPGGGCLFALRRLEAAEQPTAFGRNLGTLSASQSCRRVLGGPGISEVRHRVGEVACARLAFSEAARPQCSHGVLGHTEFL